MPQVTVKNLTNSPYDLPLKGGGTVRLGAMGGTISGEFDPVILDALRHGAAVEVLEDAPGHDEHGPATPAQGGLHHGLDVYDPRPQITLTAEEQAALDAATLPPAATGGDNPPAAITMTGPAVAVPPVAAVEPSPMLVALRNAASALGIAYESDWNEAKLQEEIGKWQETQSS